MYQEFAGIYDYMMSETPYDEWFERLHRFMTMCGKTSGHLCELGCGTGEMSSRFAQEGYEVTGIDLSPDMLALAEQKRPAGGQLLYLEQDMTDFSLHKLADVVLCICDSANYLLEEAQLMAMFSSVYENLQQDGIFIMDFKTEYCFSEILGNEVRIEDEENYTVIWDNMYDLETHINEYMLTMFVRGDDESYKRFDECHRQRAYGMQRIHELLGETGWIVTECYGADMAHAPSTQEERIYFVAHKKVSRMKGENFS